MFDYRYQQRSNLKSVKLISQKNTSMIILNLNQFESSKGLFIRNEFFSCVITFFFWTIILGLYYLNYTTMMSFILINN